MPKEELFTNQRTVKHTNVSSLIELETNPLIQEQWYHGIELRPGLFTKGYDFKNIHLTRTLLKNCRVEGLSCLDIGAMECLISVLLKRRGAATVTAYDRCNLSARIDLVKTLLKVDFNYISGIKLADLPRVVRSRGLAPFDVVVFSGIFYHLFDPMGGLAIARGLLRNGGLLILETSAILEKQMAMYFNAAGKFYPTTNYWQISIDCLDYLLRFFRLAALDCVYLTQHRDKRTNLQVYRVGIVCRAVDDYLPEPQDPWMGKAVLEEDYRDFLNWSDVRTEDSRSIDYTPGGRKLLFHEGTGSVNLWDTILANPRLKVDDMTDQVRLRLSAIY